MTDMLDISSEEIRVYVYPDDREYMIKDPVGLHVTSTGSHRVTDANGWTHRPEPGWIAVTWKPRAGAPAFVA